MSSSWKAGFPGACVCTLLTVCALSVQRIVGEGRIMYPPARSSLWRVGYNTIPNYDDHMLVCGGFNVQWKENDGKCGLCGDPWPGPRENEAGGKYATKIIPVNYDIGEIIDVCIELTANHLGYFEFRLCQHFNISQHFTQDCLDDHLLTITSTPTNSTRHEILFYNATRFISLKVKLPANVSCTACVLQWKYEGANMKGNNTTTEEECTGCGPQLMTYGCADIAIGNEDVVTAPSGNVQNDWGCSFEREPSKQRSSVLATASDGAKNSGVMIVPFLAFRLQVSMSLAATMCTTLLIMF